MDNILAMDVLECHKYLHNPRQYQLLRQMFFTLFAFADIVLEVTLLTEFQDDDKLIFLQEDIVVFDHMGIFQFFQHFYLVQNLVLGLIGAFVDAHFLGHFVGGCCQLPHQVQFELLQGVVHQQFKLLICLLVGGQIWLSVHLFSNGALKY